MIQDIIVPLIAVGLAELGDKTQLSILLLSSKTKRHAQLLLGVMLAFLIVDGAAIIAGSWITGVVSIEKIRIISGIIFIIFGAKILRESAQNCGDKVHLENPFISGFTLIFAAEMGDKTQITAGLFAARYDALMVLIGTMAALAALSFAAVYLGNRILAKFDKCAVTKVAGALFVLIGVSFLLF